MLTIGHFFDVQRLSLIWPGMLIQVLCKNVLDLACNATSTCLERSGIHPPTVKHLSSNRYRDSSVGSFSSYFKLAVHTHNLDR